MNHQIDALTPGRVGWIVAVLGIAWLVSAVVATLIGPVPVRISAALAGWQTAGGTSVDYLIVFETRLPRVLLASIVGGSLGAVSHDGSVRPTAQLFHHGNMSLAELRLGAPQSTTRGILNQVFRLQYYLVGKIFKLRLGNVISQYFGRSHLALLHSHCL